MTAIDNNEESLSNPDFSTDNDEKKLTIRVKSHEYNALKRIAGSSSESMNYLINNAIRTSYLGFTYNFAHNNKISKGVDDYIFDLIGVSERLPFYENPACSDKEVFSNLGITTDEELEDAFLKNIHLIVFRAKIVLSKHGYGAISKLPIGIAVHYLVFVLIAQQQSIHDAVKMANSCWHGYSDTIADINILREHLGLELIP